MYTTFTKGLSGADGVEIINYDRSTVSQPPAVIKNLKLISSPQTTTELTTFNMSTYQYFSEIISTTKF